VDRKPVRAAAVERRAEETESEQTDVRCYDEGGIRREPDLSSLAQGEVRAD